MTEIWLFADFDGVAYISKLTLASVFHCRHCGPLVMSSNVTSFRCLLHILSISERNPCRNRKGQPQSQWNFQIVFQPVDPSTLFLMHEQSRRFYYCTTDLLSLWPLTVSYNCLQSTYCHSYFCFCCHDNWKTRSHSCWEVRAGWKSVPVLVLPAHCDEEPH